jgi:hypothetical protein
MSLNDIFHMDLSFLKWPIICFYSAWLLHIISDAVNDFQEKKIIERRKKQNCEVEEY